MLHGRKILKRGGKARKGVEEQVVVRNVELLFGLLNYYLDYGQIIIQNFLLP